ncbi:aminoglycoside phosphotransferase [Advenella kashmirensis W13003]|uniref:Aminoglycoside 3'-phosphotransferase n=1 Tax=Advenella kashmirensis W13003 TaxID=1424334 RepID=V8QRI3_9BURK|nr:aminoglycoside 3'-phosphotransferase [Advenella kashmirensis]ETF01584.1 aminoglycoside phosphotransferase [Advenella kashmirensis W13003]
MSRERLTVDVPDDIVNIPDSVLDIAGTNRVELVWRNELGGLTFRFHGKEGTRYIKWQSSAELSPAEYEDVNLITESEKLRWAGQYVAVPRVIDCGKQNGAVWLVTEAIDAIPAVDQRWRDQAEVAVRAIATGLRRFHDALPVESCPYRGAWLRTTSVPEPERLVVCHGDPCVPNTLLTRQGGFSAHVDLCRLGIADRWADLAIATYSISWEGNFGQSYDDLFFSTYGIEPDAERIQFYRDLWDKD